jgi:hypothetical protein
VALSRGFWIRGGRKDSTLPSCPHRQHHHGHNAQHRPFSVCRSWAEAAGISAWGKDASGGKAVALVLG